MIVLMCILTIIEFKTGKILDYQPVLGDDEFAGLSADEIKRRLDYWKMMEWLKKGENIDELMKTNRSYLSLPDWLHDDSLDSVWSKALTWELMSSEKER